MHISTFPQAASAPNTAPAARNAPSTGHLCAAWATRRAEEILNGFLRGSRAEDAIDELRLLRALDDRLDAISHGGGWDPAHRPATPAYAYVRELDRVILVDWTDRRVPRALRRISLVNALHLEHARQLSAPW